MPLITLLLGLAAAILGIPTQHEPAAPSAPAMSAPTAMAPASVAPHADAEAARHLLELAAAHQRGEADAPEPTSLVGHFFVTVNDANGTLSGEVMRWYTRSPERIRTFREESVTGSRQTVGFDGEDAWFRDEQSERVVVYTEDPATFSVDIDLIREQMRLTRLLMESVVLDALLPRLSDLSLGVEGTVTDPDDEEHAVQHVLARIPDDLFPPPADAPPPMPDDPVPMLALDFAIDVADGTLWSLGVRAPGRTDILPLQLRFAFHERTSDGLRVPGNVKVYEAGRDAPMVNLGLQRDPSGRLVFRIGGDVEDRMFRVPR